MTARRILLVDDQINLTTLCRTVLERTGEFTVHEVNDGELACEAARAFSPDLIFLDCEMPAKSGLKIAAELARLKALASVPIVFMTGSIRREDGACFLNGHPALAKPFCSTELVQVARQILGRDQFAA
jgi:CheY-like chemotaxis protein